MLMSILSLLALVLLLGYLGYIVASIFKQTLASELYIRVGIAAVILALSGTPLLLAFILQGFSSLDLSNYILISRFIASVGRLLFIYNVFKLFMIKFNQFSSNQSLINLLFLIIGIVLNLSVSNEWSIAIPSLPFTVTAIPISFLRNIPTTIIGLILSILFYQNTRMSENKSLEIVPVLLALIVLLQLVQVFFLEGNLIILAFIAQLFACMGIIGCFFIDFKKSFYY